MNNPYTNYDPYAIIQQALLLMPDNPPSFPTMTPSSRGTGSSSLATSLQASLERLRNIQGLLGTTPTASQMGLLSSQITPATSRNLPSGSGTQYSISPSSFWRLSPSFWNATSNVLGAGPITPSTPTASATNTQQALSLGPYISNYPNVLGFPFR